MTEPQFLPGTHEALWEEWIRIISTTEAAFKNDSESNVFSIHLSSFAFKALFKAPGGHETFKKKNKNILIG